MKGYIKKKKKHATINKVSFSQDETAIKNQGIEGNNRDMYFENIFIQIAILLQRYPFNFLRGEKY